MTDDMRGDDVYQPDVTDIDGGPDDDLDMENALDEPDLDQIMDTSYSPPERPLVVEDFGTTATEQAMGEPLERRLNRERPDIEPEPGDGIGDLAEATGEVLDDQAGDHRTGRLVREDDPRAGNRSLAHDVGIDGGAASAEEAAVHTLPDDTSDEEE